MKKKILAHFDFFPPRYNAGAERYAFALFKYLMEQGHEVTVLTQPKMGPDGYNYEGITVYTDEKTHLNRLYDEADYVVTQIAYSAKVKDLCKRRKKKLIYLVHNTRSLSFWNIAPEEVFLTVWNADWVRDYVKDQIKWLPVNHDVTLYPPVIFEKFQIPEEHKVEEKPYDVTLVNMCHNKGVHTLIQAAKMNPDLQFAGVVGAYDDQVLRNIPKNIKIINHTPNMVENVYSKSKVLIVPSKKETWGMVAIEAMCSGIPVIAHPTEGLVEACGNAGLFIHRDKAFLWDAMIKRLVTDKEFYEGQSERCIARARELDRIIFKQLEQVNKIISEDETV